MGLMTFFITRFPTFILIDNINPDKVVRLLIVLTISMFETNVFNLIFHLPHRSSNYSHSISRNAIFITIHHLYQLQLICSNSTLFIPLFSTFSIADFVAVTFVVEGSYRPIFCYYYNSEYDLLHSE